MSKRYASLASDKPQQHIIWRNWNKKSRGHICFHGPIEYVDINGSIFCGNRNRSFDPEGYRYGLESNCYTRSVDRENLLKDIHDFLEQYPQYKTYCETGLERDRP